MSLWRMAWRALWRRPVVSGLAWLGIVLGAALVTGVLALRRETQRALMAEAGQADLVVGAKGSPLQLVLSSLYHLDQPTGNIPFARLEALRGDRRVAHAFPVALGDNYRGFRIVGTDPAWFDFVPRGAETPLLELARGRRFEADFEAVVGAEVARSAGLDVGDRFVGTHGLVPLPGSEDHDDFPYTVAGVLAPSGTSHDRAIFVSVPSVWIVHEEEARLHGREPSDEVTAVLVTLRTPGLRMRMVDQINRDTESMAAVPLLEIMRLSRQVLAPLQASLLAVAGVVVLVASLTVLTTLIQAADRQRRDHAVLRTLGAHPGEVFALVLLQGAWLTATGLAAGWLAAHAGLALSAPRLAARVGLRIQTWTPGPEEAWALAAVAAAGLAASLISALSRYRVEPIRVLADGGA